MQSHRNFSDVEVVWKPDNVSGKILQNFKKMIEDKYGVTFADYWELHKWTIDHIQEFWAEMWIFADIIYSKTYDQVIDLNILMMNSPKWFQGAKLNFAENVLKYRDDHIAMIVTGEDRDTERVTYAQMYEETQLYAAALRKLGLKPEDRVVCYMSNRKEPIFAMLATTSIGGIWTGALPLMGAQAVLNRFRQVQPRILFTQDRFQNDNEEIEMLHKVKEIAEGLPTLEKVVIVPSKEESKLKDISGIRNSCFLDEFLETGREEDGSVAPMKFEQFSFSHPVFISYTSGTSGLPKVLVHGSGGLLTVNRDFMIHRDGNRNDISLSMSPVGWATWNVFATMHSLGLTVVYFEGVPYFLSPTYFWDMIDELQITSLLLPTSILDSLEKKSYLPTDKHHLDSLRVITAGGSVVKPQNYDFVYKKIKPDVIFSAAYGTTELMGSCPLLNDPSVPVYKGEMPCPSLGTDIQCVNESGKYVTGEVGELVVRKHLPTLPLGLWGDVDGSVFKKTYFSKFPSGDFAVGDLVIINPVTKGVIFCCRSDDTLKPKGCRFGSSEIYNVVDTFNEVEDSMCVSQYNKDMEERAVLFLKMKDNHLFTEELVRRIRTAIAKELSLRHVPEVILETTDIPHNMNGKKMEIIVKKIINNMPYNPDTISNIESLQNFYNIPELEGF